MENNREPKSGITIQSITGSVKISSLKLGSKIRLALSASLLGALIILILFAWFRQRAASLSSGYEMLALMESVKKQHVEDEMSRVRNQLQLFVTDSRTLGAFSSLCQGFKDIESDNYYSDDVASLNDMRQKLENYFITVLIPQIELKTTDHYEPGDFLSTDNKQTILQCLYLASNDRPLSLKQEITGAGDGSLYSGIHVQHQPWLLTYARKNKISDIYFVDATTGYVFYSLRKHPDFATNLFSGRYKNSMLSKAFRLAISKNAKGSVYGTDMDRRIPGILPPCFYMSAPVTQGNQIIGAVIFGMDYDFLDHLAGNGSLAGSSKMPAISTVILGSDRVYRSNDPGFLSNTSRFLKKLRYNLPGDNITAIAKSHCTAMNLTVNGKVFTNAGLGIAGKGKFKTPAGRTAICSYTPIEKTGLNWILLIQAPLREILRPARSLVWLLSALGLALLLLLYWLNSRFSKSIALRAHAVHELMSPLADGEQTDASMPKAGDELDQARLTADRMVKRFGDVAQFASSLTEGRLDSDFALSGEEDVMGLSLNKLRESMIQTRKDEEGRKIEDEIRNWTAQGIAMFNDILRQDNNDIKKLSFNVIKNLIQYLSANQGGFFLLEDEFSKEPYLNLIAAYAYDRQKFLQKQIKVGEGLIGNCVLEKQTIYLKDIPKGYIEIRSGLGGSVPRALLIVPLKKEDQITGVIELASFNELKKHEIDFVEKIAESIASTMVTVKLHEQTALLLEESKKRSEEISQQEEELRQNLEELKATQEEMARIRRDEEQKEKERREIEHKMMEQLREQQQLLSKEKALLDALLNSANESIYFKDLKSRFIRFSASMLKLFKLSKPEELIGKSDFDMFDEEHARPAYEDEQGIIRTGIPIIDKIEKEVLPDGRINYVNTSKMPLRNENNQIIGTFGISKDVTVFVNLQEEIKAKEAVIKEKDEEIKKLQEAIKNLKKSSKG